MIDFLMNSQKSKTELDQLITHLKAPGEHPLKDEALQYRLRRIKKADELLYQFKVTKTAVDIMLSYFREQDPKYSMATAYADVRDAKFVFGFDIDKKYERIMLSEWLKTTMMKAITGNKPDYKAFASMATTLAKVLGLDREDIEVPDYSKIQPPDIIYGFFPEEMSKNLPPEEELDEILEKLKKPRTKKQNELGETATIISESKREAENS